VWVREFFILETAVCELWVGQSIQRIHTGATRAKARRLTAGDDRPGSLSHVALQDQNRGRASGCRS
jgi:hypothetical protein